MSWFHSGLQHKQQSLNLCMLEIDYNMSIGEHSAMLTVIGLVKDNVPSLFEGIG